MLTAAGTKEVVFESSPRNFPNGLRGLCDRGVAFVRRPAGECGCCSFAGGDATLLPNPLARVKAVNAEPTSNGLNYLANGATLLSNVPYKGCFELRRPTTFG